MRAILLLSTFLLILTSGFSQSLCDTSKIFTILDHPPKPRITDADLELKLNSAIDSTLLVKYNADYLYVTFYVNCNGEGFNYKLAKFADGLTKLDSSSDFQKTFLSTFQSFISWSPGLFTLYEKGKPVTTPANCYSSYIIRVDDNKFHILSEKEKQKHFKSKQKK